MNVLLLVDIQNDFCPGGSLAVPAGNEVVAVANALMRSGRYDLVIATKDWHPADHKSFAVNHPGKGVYESVDLDGVQQTLWPAHCVQGSKGAEFHPELDVSRIDAVVEKGTNQRIDSYSGFFDNQKRNETPLKAILDRAASAAGIAPHQIDITVLGLATDYCVAATAIDAAEHGYKTTIAIDGCRAVNLAPGDDIRALQRMAAKGIEAVESRELLEGLQPARPAAKPIERGIPA